MLIFESCEAQGRMACTCFTNISVMWQPTLGGRRFQTAVSFSASLRKNAPGLERSLGRGRACCKPPSPAPRQRGPAQAQVWRLSTSEEHSLAQWSVQMEHSAAGYQQRLRPSSPLLLSFQGITNFVSQPSDICPQEFPFWQLHYLLVQSLEWNRSWELWGFTGYYTWSWP